MSTVLILPTIMLIVGLALLVWSSDFFIDGAASIAVRYNVSPSLSERSLLDLAHQAQKLSLRLSPR